MDICLLAVYYCLLGTTKTTGIVSLEDLSYLPSSAQAQVQLDTDLIQQPSNPIQTHPTNIICTQMYPNFKVSFVGNTAGGGNYLIT